MPSLNPDYSPGDIFSGQNLRERRVVFSIASMGAISALRPLSPAGLFTVW
jgi:hypothetical protein